MRGGLADITATASVEAVAAAIRAAIADIQAIVTLSADGTVSVGEILFAEVAILVAASIVGAAVCVRSGAVEITIAGALAAAAWRCGLGDIFQFTGDFANGKEIVIDLDAKTITVDGVNALHQVSGGFFKFSPGANAIVYEDDESARSVGAEVEHRDRWA